MEFLSVLKKIFEEEEIILGEDFTGALERSATELFTQKLTSEQGVKMIKDYCSLLPRLEQNYFEQCTDQFLAFALNFSDKNLYHLFTSVYKSRFDSVRDDPLNHNELALYICKRILAISNKKWILLFVQSRMEQTKTVEKKFILLELLGVLAKGIENKEAFFPQLLPEILRAVMDGIKKFEKYRSKFSSEDMNSSARIFQDNFEGWVIDFLTRFFACLKALPEVKANGKKLLLIRDLLEVDFETSALVPKSPSANTLIVHYVTLFYLDILQGINEALHQTGVFDETRVKSFLDNSQKAFLEIIPSVAELVENFAGQLRYQQYSGTPQPAQVIDYTPYISYNLTGIAHFIKLVFAEKSFQFLYSEQYKLRILLPFLSDFLKKEASKVELVKPLIIGISDIIKEGSIQPGSLTNANFFNVKAGEVLVAILEPIGQSFEKEAQKGFIQTLQDILALFTAKARFEIYSSMIGDNQNSHMAAFILDLFRKELKSQMASDLTASSSGFTAIDSLSSLLQNLVEKQASGTNNLSEKASILNSALSTIEFVLMRMKATAAAGDKFITSDETHLLNKKSMQSFAQTVTNLTQQLELRIRQSNDDIAKEKHEIQNAGSVESNEEKLHHEKEESLSMIKFHVTAVSSLVGELAPLIAEQ